MNINIVTGPAVLEKIKKSKYYKSNLGFSATITDKKSGDRIFSTKDPFLHYYNTKYNTTANRVGNVGNVNFYIDYYIRDESIATYCEEVEYIIKFNNDKYKSVGIDSYLGFIIRTMLENEKVVRDAKDMVVDQATTQKELKPTGNSEILFKSPGNVKYEDVVKYMQEKNKPRI